MNLEEQLQAQVAELKRENEAWKNLVREWQGVANSASAHFAYYPEEWTKYYEKLKQHTNHMLAEAIEQENVTCKDHIGEAKLYTMAAYGHFIKAKYEIDLAMKGSNAELLLRLLSAEEEANKGVNAAWHSQLVLSDILFDL